MRLKKKTEMIMFMLKNEIVSIIYKNATDGMHIMWCFTDMSYVTVIYL